jgi:hypothetical protein
VDGAAAVADSGGSGDALVTSLETRKGEKEAVFTRSAKERKGGREGGHGRRRWPFLTRCAERGCPTPTSRRLPYRQRTETTGASDAVWPCRVAGSNRGGGGRLTGGGLAQWRATAVESVEKENSNSIGFKRL